MYMYIHLDRYLRYIVNKSTDYYNDDVNAAAHLIVNVYRVTVAKHQGVVRLAVMLASFRTCSGQQQVLVSHDVTEE